MERRQQGSRTNRGASYTTALLVREYSDSFGIGEKNFDVGYMFNVGSTEFSERVVLVFGIKDRNESSFSG